MHDDIIFIAIKMMSSCTQSGFLVQLNGHTQARGPSRRGSAYEISKSSGFQVDFWISGFRSGFLDFKVDFKVDFWISKWISGFQSGFLDFIVDFWISRFQIGFLDFKLDFRRQCTRFHS